MRLSTIMLVIVMLDVFCFYGVQTADVLKGNPIDTTMEQIGDRPLGRMVEFNQSTGQLGTDANTTFWDDVIAFGGGIGMAVLDATGLSNLAREIQNAVDFFKEFLLSPFLLSEIMGNDTVWLISIVPSVLYSFLILMGLLALWKGGSV